MKPATPTGLRRVAKHLRDDAARCRAVAPDRVDPRRWTRLADDKADAASILEAVAAARRGVARAAPTPPQERVEAPESTASPDEGEAEALRALGARFSTELTARVRVNGCPVSIPASEHEMLGRTIALAMVESGWLCTRNGVQIARVEPKPEPVEPEAERRERICRRCTTPERPVYTEVRSPAGAYWCTCCGRGDRIEEVALCGIVLARGNGSVVKCTSPRGHVGPCSAMVGWL